nr:disease resistance protein RPP13-like isoform X6 [Ipomoea batatas]
MAIVVWTIELGLLQSQPGPAKKIQDEQRDYGNNDMVVIEEGILCEEWELEDEVFGQLIYLEINSIDLKQWKAGSHNFPKLERLLLYRCKKLEEIPPDFGEIQNLKLIELKGCLTSVVDSAKQIETDQRDSGNDDMIVIEENAIQPNDELEADEDDFDEL